MTKCALTSATVLLMSLFLLTACADESADTDSASPAEVASEQGAAPQDTVMDQPVDFSSTENVDKTFENIRQQAGENSAKKLKSAMEYMMFYDLEVKRNKEVLHKKLDGKTPNEIIGMVKRFKK